MPRPLSRIGTLAAAIALTAAAEVPDRNTHAPGDGHRHAPNFCYACERTPAGRIRRSSTARRAFRAEHPCPATGEIGGACVGYQIDHVISLACGGADGPDNMRWLAIEEHRVKSADERAVCGLR